MRETERHIFGQELTRKVNRLQALIVSNNNPKSNSMQPALYNEATAFQRALIGELSENNGDNRSMSWAIGTYGLFFQKAYSIESDTSLSSEVRDQRIAALKSDPTIIAAAWVRRIALDHPLTSEEIRLIPEVEILRPPTSLIRPIRTKNSREGLVNGSNSRGRHTRAEVLSILREQNTNGLPYADIREVMEITGLSRARAHAVVGELLASHSDLPPKRPPNGAESREFFDKLRRAKRIDILRQLREIEKSGLAQTPTGRLNVSEAARLIGVNRRTAASVWNDRAILDCEVNTTRV